MQQNDYITLRGQQFRVEVNMAALQKFCNLKGIKDMRNFNAESLSSFEDAQAMIFYCIEQGAIRDKVDLPFTRKDVGEWIRIPSINAFMEIYKNQSSGVEQPAIISKKKPKLLSRMFRFRSSN